jgi:ABC-type polar amino acid transport system ATPase subunit
MGAHSQLSAGQMKPICGRLATVKVMPRVGEAVMGLLRELHRSGATICMVTHDLRYAQHADRIVHMFDGLIVEEETGANGLEIECT